MEMIWHQAIRQCISHRPNVLLILLKKESIILLLSKQVFVPICMIIDMVVATRKKWLHFKRFQKRCEHAALLVFGSRYLEFTPQTPYQ